MRYLKLLIFPLGAEISFWWSLERISFLKPLYLKLNKSSQSFPYLWSESNSNFYNNRCYKQFSHSPMVKINHKRLNHTNLFHISIGGIFVSQKGLMYSQNKPSKENCYVTLEDRTHHLWCGSDSDEQSGPLILFTFCSVLLYT